MTEDPIKLAGGLNNYRYVPNPVQWVDPLGLQNKENHDGLPLNTGVPEDPDPVKESFFGLNKDENGDWVLRVGPSSWEGAVNASDSFGLKRNADGDAIMCLGEKGCSNPDLVSDIGTGDVVVTTVGTIAGGGVLGKILRPSSPNVNESWFKQYKNNSTHPEIRDDLFNTVQDIRADLPDHLASTGNVGVAKLNVEGLPTSLKSHSRVGNIGGEQIEGFVSLPNKPQSEWVFQPKDVSPVDGTVNGPNAFTRQYDTEFKILEDVAGRLGDNKNAAGTIDLFTERKACQSCTDVITEFREHYPNIQLNIFTGK